MVLVGEVMQNEVISVGEGESLADVYQVMSDNKFRHVPVVNEDKELVGLVSERDLLRTYFEGESVRDLIPERGELLYDHPVIEVMSAEPETVDSETPLADACRIMLENKFDCLPVVDGKRLVGIITTSDVMTEMVRREEQDEAVASAP